MIEVELISLSLRNVDQNWPPLW